MKPLHPARWFPLLDEIAEITRATRRQQLATAHVARVFAYRHNVPLVEARVLAARSPGGFAMSEDSEMIGLNVGAAIENVANRTNRPEDL
jgi:hypothetical protein